MRTYRDFKEVATDPLQDLEKQIDVLFDELKQKLRNPTNPRRGIDDFIKKWMPRIKVTESLEEYHTKEIFLQELHEAISTEENLDTILDEYREKLKQIVRTFAQQAAQPMQSSPEPAQPKIEPQAQPEPEEQPQAVSPTQPEPTQSKAEPQAVSPEPTQPEPSGEEKLMKLGAAVVMARDMTGKDDVSQDDIRHFLNLRFDPQTWAAMKDIYIKAAKEYLQSISNSSLDKPPTVGALNTDLPTPQNKTPLTGAPAAQIPTIEELRAMTSKKFKKLIKENDPELAGAYGVDENNDSPWPPSMRIEIAREYLRKAKLDQAKAATSQPKIESLKSRVDLYKEMLRLSDRPQILRHKAIKVPFSERVSFYKEKLKKCCC